MLSFSSWAVYFNHWRRISPIMFSCMYLTVTLMMPLGSRIVNFTWFRLTVWALLISTAASYLSLPHVEYLWQDIIVLIAGLAVPAGLLFTIPALCTMKYFPLRGPEANNIIQGWQGVASAVITYITYLCNNPYHEPVPLRVENGISFRYDLDGTLTTIGLVMILASIYVICNLKYPKTLNSKLLLEYEKASEEAQKKARVGQIQMKSPEESSENTFSGVDSTARNIDNESGDLLPSENKFAPTSECKNYKSGIMSSTFFLLIVAGFTTLNGFYIMASYKLTGFNIDDRRDDLLTLAATLGFLMFGLFRLLTRKIIQKTGFFVVFMGYLCINLTSICLQLLSTDKLSGLIYSIVLGMAAAGGLISWFTLYTMKLFGYRLATRFIQTMLLMFAIFNVSISAVGSEVDSQTMGVIMLVLNIVGTLAYCFIKEDRIWDI